MASLLRPGFEPVRLAAFAVGAVRAPHPASDNQIIQRLAYNTPDHPDITPEPPDDAVSGCGQTVDRSHGVKYHEITGGRLGASNGPSWISCEALVFSLEEAIPRPTHVEIPMRLAASFVAILLPLCLSAQEQERPQDRTVRFDRADAKDSAPVFVTMTPGWHVTTGPAAILYDPSHTATGTFRMESEIFLFDPGDRHREAFGVFFGGRIWTSRDRRAHISSFATTATS